MWTGLFAFAALALSACRVDVTVDIDVAADGAGTVTVAVVFDTDVLEYVPDLDQILRLDDVRAAGWVIEETRDGGGLAVRLVKPFVSVDQLPLVLSELDGPGGLFEGATLDVGREGAVTEYRLQVALSLDRPVTSLIDPGVADVLDGELFGTPISELERRAGHSLDEAVSFVVSAKIPGGSGRLPEDGVIRLVGGGSRVLEVTTEVVDTDIAAADAAATDARADVSTAVTMTVVVWVTLLVGLLALIVVRRLNRLHGRHTAV